LGTEVDMVVVDYADILKDTGSAKKTGDTRIRIEVIIASVSSTMPSGSYQCQ